MDTTEMLNYLQEMVASQGTQAGISVSPLLEAMIQAIQGQQQGAVQVLGAELEDNEENTKKVTNTQDEIDAFIAAANASPLLVEVKAHTAGAVLSFPHVEISETEINAMLDAVEGSYILTLSTTPDSSQMNFIPATPNVPIQVVDELPQSPDPDTLYITPASE